MQSLYQKREQQKRKCDVSLCDNLKLFGRCSSLQCPRTHIPHKMDVSDHLPQSGKIKFKIVHLHDVTNYSVALLQHHDTEGKVHEFPEDASLEEDLSAAMKVARKQAIRPVVGAWYAYYDVDESDGAFHRCELLETDGDCVRLKLVDRGGVVCTVRNRLFKLPREFRKRPRKGELVGCEMSENESLCILLEHVFFCYLSSKLYLLFLTFNSKQLVQ